MSVNFGGALKAGELIFSFNQNDAEGAPLPQGALSSISFEVYDPRPTPATLLHTGAGVWDLATKMWKLAWDHQGALEGVQCVVVVVLPTHATAATWEFQQARVQVNLRNVDPTKDTELVAIYGGNQQDGTPWPQAALSSIAFHHYDLTQTPAAVLASLAGKFDAALGVWKSVWVFGSALDNLELIELAVVPTHATAQPWELPQVRTQIPIGVPAAAAAGPGGGLVSEDIEVVATVGDDAVTGGLDQTIEVDVPEGINVAVEVEELGSDLEASDIEADGEVC